MKRSVLVQGWTFSFTKLFYEVSFCYHFKMLITPIIEEGCKILCFQYNAELFSTTIAYNFTI